MYESLGIEKISKDNVVKFPSKMTDLEKQIEAVIFAAAEPLDIDTIESKILKSFMVSFLILINLKLILEFLIYLSQHFVFYYL